MSHRGAIGSSPVANAIVRSQQELLLDLAQGAEPGDQGVLKGGAGGRRLAGLGKVPAQQFARVAVDQ
ncbi:hypothetical protein [Arenibacterium sp. LLYu02]|uniref:hypothetical protein n=1 Tax=Arenibacterium sp. LLYu02 TaxID=3404132 RepID=UPI003B21C529